MPPLDLNGTQARIDAQIAVVGSLVPGSGPHRIATQVLLLLQDSLHIHHQIDALLDAAEALRQRAEG